MKKIYTLFFFTVLSTALWAQEICDNGIDDDGDGFIDCYDSDCTESDLCDGFYLGDDADCEVEPSEFPAFTMELDFSSPDETTNHIGRMSIGDVDRDGIPEIVTMNRYTKILYILNGEDGSIEHSKSVSFEPLWEIALANIDDDDCAELFFQGKESGSLYLYSYDCELNLNWKQQVFSSSNGNAIDGLMYGLADFDGDGNVEIYVKDIIMDAHTGTIICNTSATSADEWLDTNGGPTAVDILGDDDLELVLGCNIYEVNLGARTAGSGSLTLLKSLADYEPSYQYNSTSVADYNLDGYLDIIATGGLRHSDGNLYHTCFFWDVQNDTYESYSDPLTGNYTIEACPTQTGTYYKYGWKNGLGRVNIGDLDGDGQLNVSYVSGTYLYALDENLDLLWKITINEETSGYTGCTLFDFNGDGQSEIVYRDERYLYIINGVDGTISSQQACISRTNREYPIVADVDADGATELCVTCGFDNQAASDNFCTLSYARYSHVRVFESASEPWVPARQLWNQHGYFNVNVNDDLTIPRRQQKHHLVWSTEGCDGTPEDVRPLNSFLNQSPYLNSSGCTSYAAVDIAMVDGSIEVDDPTCPDTDFDVTFQFTNAGDLTITDDLYVTFYKEDPTASGSTRLNTETVSMLKFAPGDTLTTTLTVTGDGSAFTLYIVLNDDGSATLPMTLPLDDAPISECDGTNDIGSADVNPLSVPITAETVANNIQCTGSSTPSNGAVTAYIEESDGTQNTADYYFYWFDGTTAGAEADADYVGATYTSLATGDYTVYAIHKSALCNSDTATATVAQEDSEVSAEIVQIDAYDNCTDPNASLTVVVNSGADPDDYEYIWYEGNQAFLDDAQISINDTVTDLSAITYTVLVTDKTTGCQDVKSFTIEDDTTTPEVDTEQTDLTCTTDDNGVVSASVGGSTTGYTFEWYDGSYVLPTASHTGAEYTGLAAGNYTVTATDDASGCTSDAVTVTLTQTTPPVVTATLLANQTSCDDTQPNGSVTANVGGTTDGYSFEWFYGQNTLAANSVGTTNTITDLAAGVYTVEVTDDDTGCSSTEEVTVISAQVTPEITAVVSNTTTCNLDNGSVTVSVSYGDVGEYTFAWYDGESVKSTADYTDTDNVLDGLSPGTYTVQATHNTNYCVADAITVTVEDDAPITITFDTSSSLPADCNDNSGTLIINLSSDANTTEGFDVSWYAGTTPPTSAAIQESTAVFTDEVDNVSAGIYTIIAQDLATLCYDTTQITLPFLNAQEIALSSSVNPDDCTDEGEITVTLTKSTDEAPITFSEADYEIHLYAGEYDLGMDAGSSTDDQLLDVITGTDGVTDYTFSNLAAGTYTLVAISTNSATAGCRSSPVTIELEDLSEDPVIVGDVTANTYCYDATNPASGSIVLEINSGADAVTNYTFDWYEGDDTSTAFTGTVNADGNEISELEPGYYTVVVTDNVTPSAGCSTTKTFQIFDAPPVVTIGDGDISISNITLCSSVNSEVEITAVSEDGVQVSISDYTFEWYDASMTALAASYLNAAGTIASGLDAGTYYVQATSSVNNCSTTLLEFEIEDETPGTVDVSLTGFTNPTRCLKPSNYDGELITAAAGSSTSGYTFNWYEGSSATGTIISNSSTLSGISTTSLVYTLEVINNDNQCDTVKTYTLTLLSATVRISASAEDVTYCDTDNGEVFATVTTGSADEYTYNWSIGTAVTTPADYTGQTVTDLSAGSYTVVAIDDDDSTCESDPSTVVIDTNQEMPTVTVTDSSPVTYCDTSIPNGTASASVDGDITNYTFVWYEGDDTSGTAVFTGPDATSLEAMQYTVEATHNITGCSGTASVTIEYSPEAVPEVQIEVVAQQTSCTDPNGSLTASVGGVTDGYTFDWSIGSTAASVPDFTGITWEGLEAGTYTVVATDNVTGCQSDPDTEEIVDDLTYPEVEFTIVDSECPIDANLFDGQAGDDPTGTVTILYKNDVNVSSVVWYLDGVEISSSPRLGDAEPGIYTVVVTTDLGCSTTAEVEIKSEIHPYNGISRNGDSYNDRFYINCISDYPDNIVKIFNRAGTLVYEAEGYDNIDIYFDGISNKGIDVMGKNLPDGTYFYVINKRDGSNPLAGYLEIVN